MQFTRPIFQSLLHGRAASPAGLAEDSGLHIPPPAPAPAPHSHPLSPLLPHTSHVTAIITCSAVLLVTRVVTLFRPATVSSVAIPLHTPRTGKSPTSGQSRSVTWPTPGFRTVATTRPQSKLFVKMTGLRVTRASSLVKRRNTRQSVFNVRSTASLPTSTWRSATVLPSFRAS